MSACKCDCTVNVIILTRYIIFLSFQGLANYPLKHQKPHFIKELQAYSRKWLITQ